MAKTMKVQLLLFLTIGFILLYITGCKSDKTSPIDSSEILNPDDGPVAGYSDGG